MLCNYLTIAIRNLLRHKAFSLINIVGLTIGMTCCLLIMLFVQHELSYDTFHERADRIYRVTYEPKFAGIPRPLAVLPPPAGPLMPGYFPEIATAARLYGRDASIEVVKDLQARREKYEEENFFFADSTVLKIFTFRSLQGDPAAVLREQFSVIVTDRIARKYFGPNWNQGSSVVGQTLLFAGTHPMKIAAVVEEFPDNSHIHFNFLASYDTMYALDGPDAKDNLTHNWVISHSYTYVLLKPHQRPETVEAKFPAFLRQYGSKQFSKDIVYRLQALKDIHLRSDLMSEAEPVGSITFVYVFVGIAAITLLIACINFINLSTARSLKRAKEVGMRKVLGAEKRQLVGQFLGESFLMSSLSFVLSCVLASLLLPLLDQLTEKHLSMGQLWNNGALVAAMVGIFLLTSLLAGSYPAFFVSGFRPIETLKGNFTSGNAKGGILRQSLVVLQFTASITLIAGALITYRQLQFIRNQPLGFEKDYVVTAPLISQSLNNIFANPDDSLYQRLKTFEEVIRQNPNVQAVTLSNRELGQGAVRHGVIPEGFTQENNLFISCLSVDYNFLKTYGLPLLAGRDFSEAFETDKEEAFIINEQGVRDFGWKTPAAALGKTIDREGKKGKIIGVIKDFHNESLHQPTAALLMDVNLSALAIFSIKLRSQNVPETLAFIDAQWSSFFHDKVFDYHFLDQQISQQYASEQRLAQLMGYFAGMAILISCLGLYGLVLLVIQQRTREIGIRKVLGASVPDVVTLLSRNFVALVILSSAIATPIAWWAMSKWLEDFAYRANVSWWVFALAGLSALVIALLTVSYQAIKAALANPVKSLRSE